jgi:hypothetical protein
LYSSFWFGIKAQIQPCSGRGLRHEPAFQCSQAGTGYCDIPLCDIAAKVTAFAQFALQPHDNGKTFDPLEVKHFVYTRRRPPTFMRGFSEALSGIRPVGQDPPFQIFDFNSFDYDMLARVDAVNGDTVGIVKRTPGNVRLKNDVVVQPHALGVLVLTGNALQRTVLKQAFGYHDGSQRFDGLLREGGMPLVQVMLAFDESNQGITLLRLQFVHFMEPSLAGVQYNEIIQATGRGLRPNCHQGVAERLRFVRTKVYVAQPPPEVVKKCMELEQGLDTEELLHFRGNLEELESQKDAVEAEIERATVSGSLMSKERNLERTKSELANKPTLPMTGADLSDEDKEAARRRRDYRKLLNAQISELRAAVAQLKKLDSALKKLQPKCEKAEKLIAELKSGKMFAYEWATAGPAAAAPKSVKPKLITLYPELLDKLVFEHIEAKHNALLPIQEMLKVCSTPRARC